MKKSRQKRWLAAAPLLAVMTFGCSQGITDAPTTPTVSFSYSGPVSGTFQAQGAPRLDVLPLLQTYAAGLKFDNPSGLEVQASLIHGDALVDDIDISLPSQAKGNYTIDDAQCPQVSDQCPGVLVAFDLQNNVPVSQARFSCTLVSGTINVSDVSSTRLVGAFSGVGHCITDQGAVVEGFQLMNGRFDVGLTQGSR